ncbi:site-specific integrase [Aeromonas hydrophila]|uniref:site-specific integrase n=1 Tax=Aeromonas hydrophila TaxID=644 RepID=UPI000AA8613D|nr:site-specific integrase [Aeromonas hydrophila]HAT1543752.1 tyrosine-type recombinase/integrase [Aeromonas hydrophila]HAT1554220.1 tyrosine-type recombinase/integrase [Aeromonas hydrophila]
MNNIEHVDNAFSKNNLQQLLAQVCTVNKNEVSKQVDINVINLLTFPVTSKSLFKDKVWDYTADVKVAKTIDRTRLIINFSVYENIPESIMVEIKVATLFIRLLPKLSRNSRKNKGQPLSMQSITPMVKSWLDFMDYFFNKAGEEYGSAFCREKYSSLIDITYQDYKQFSIGYQKAESTVSHIEQVFEWFSHDRILNALYSQRPFLPKIEHLSITQIEKKEDDREKIIPDEIFDKVVTISSCLISDFLHKMGLPIKDKIAENKLELFRHDLPPSVMDIKDSDIEYYIGMRLYKKSLDIELVRSKLNTKLIGDVRAADFRRPEGRTEDIFNYTKLIHEAAMYIIAQFTGMRPSEFIEIRVDKPLTSSFDIPCICSTVHKHRSTSRRLFDDLWVAIPAVEDAMAALAILTRIRNNPFVYSKSETLKFNQEPRTLAKGICEVIKNYFYKILADDELKSVDFFPYMMRHTLAYQMYKVELGLPFISHQLKHFGNLVQSVGAASNKGFSSDTMCYGDIGDMLSGIKVEKNNLRHQAEVHLVKEMYDPNGTYAGVNAEAHKKRLRKLFEGYQAAGYSNDEVFEAMAQQGMAVINVGTGMCYGGRVEDFDQSLPCIGSLRCNPNRCHQAVITKAHIPKWREVYEQNMKVVSLGESETNYRQAVEAANEAKGVLEYLGVFK